MVFSYAGATMGEIWGGGNECGLKFESRALTILMIEEISWRQF